MKWLRSHSLYIDTEFKAHESQEHAFAHLSVKIKKELVAFGHEVSLEQKGISVTASEWRRMLEEETESQAFARYLRGEEV
jgi:UPF0176 protein